MSNQKNMNTLVVKEDVDFPVGVTILFGVMRAGKTTVVNEWLARKRLDAVRLVGLTDKLLRYIENASNTIFVCEEIVPRKDIDFNNLINTAKKKNLRILMTVDAGRLMETVNFGNRSVPIKYSRTNLVNVRDCFEEA